MRVRVVRPGLALTHDPCSIAQKLCFLMQGRHRGPKFVSVNIDPATRHVLL